MKTIAKIQLLIMTIVMSFALTSCTATDQESTFTSTSQEMISGAADTFTFTLPKEISRYTRPQISIWPRQ